MRIISLVPSWTETLIESGIYPIGRTRFCIHPKQLVENIPIVGGTKTVNWDLIRKLKPDLLILDQEENPKDFSEKGISFWASHVIDGQSLEKGLSELSEILKNNQLKKLSQLCRQINLAVPASPPTLGEALIKTIHSWGSAEQVAYMILKKPWMSISKATYIGFVLERLGFKLYDWKQAEKKYPTVDLNSNLEVVYLFSSEPYPFLKDVEELASMNLKSAIVDGEKISWFGIRSLRFLQKALQLPDLP